jgi:serine O-acetyltransferase
MNAIEKRTTISSNDGESVWSYIKSDYYRYEGNFGSITAILNKALLKPLLRPSAVGFAFSFWHRLCRSKLKFLSLLGRYNVAKFALKYGIDCPPRVKFGKGLYIGHATSGLVIRGHSTIGKNFTVLHGVTIGNSVLDAEKFTVIGDNVYVGAGASTVKSVTIGDNVTIGAGAVVTKDVPDNVTVGGVPARVLNYNDRAVRILNPL